MRSRNWPRSKSRSKALGVHRPVAQVEATIAGVLARPVTIGDRVRGTVGALSDSCARNETRTAADCVEVAALRAELAVAVEATRLEARAAHLRQQVIALRERGGSAAPDPVGEFWAWITRGWVSVKDVGLRPAACVCAHDRNGLRIRTTRDCLLRGSDAHSDTDRHVAPCRGGARHGPQRRRRAATVAMSQKDAGRVVHYMADRTEPTTQSGCRWCRAALRRL